MNIDLNSIGKAIFNEHSDKEKNKCSLSYLKFYNGELVSFIRNKYVYNFTESPEKTIEFLKSVLEYCYLNNINLNDYIVVSEK